VIWLAKNWRIALFGIVALCLAVAVNWTLWQRTTIAKLKSERDDLAGLVRSYEEATKIRRLDDLRRADIAADAVQFSTDIAKTEGGDAPLDPYLASGARKLWP
jgi:predicted negative regulator of RcsB-dependent stress response